MTRLQIYRALYFMRLGFLVSNGHDPDKASRMANIFAVQNTNEIFKMQKIDGSIFI